jgi:hypothetical protein
MDPGGSSSDPIDTPNPTGVKQEPNPALLEDDHQTSQFAQIHSSIEQLVNETEDEFPAVKTVVSVDMSKRSNSSNHSNINSNEFSKEGLSLFEAANGSFLSSEY